MRLSQIKNILNAELLGQDTEFQDVSIDTRTLTKDSLFVALKGAKFDGHHFIKEALQKGAKAILASQKSEIPPHASALVVSDTYDALAKLATFHRMKFHMPCIGITGSCGKTTVKGMVGSILSGVGPTLVTQGNLNNHIGLPLMLLKLKSEHQAMVLEMGANAPAEIAYLGQIAKPTIALINNVQPVHLEGFGSIDNIAKAKGEIYEALAPEGVAILNLESPYVHEWQQVIQDKKTITFGFSEKAMIRAEQIQLEPLKTTFKLITPDYEGTMQLSLPGEHNVMNALAAIACVFPLKIPFQDIQEGLKHFEGISGRLTMHPLSHGGHLIDDTYNANPKAFEEALKVMNQFIEEKLLVMGDMAELGPLASEIHKEVGELVKRSGIQNFWAVGPLSHYAVEGFGKTGRWFSDKKALLSELQAIDKPMTILIKGSRSAAMETLVKGLLQHEEA